MASGVKQAVRLKVRGCQVKLGVRTTKLDAYVTNLGTYDPIDGMDWLEGHRDFMDCYVKYCALMMRVEQFKSMVEGGKYPFVSSLR